MTIIPSLGLDLLTKWARDIVYQIQCIAWTLFILARRALVMTGFLIPKPEELDLGLTTLGMGEGGFDIGKALDDPTGDGFDLPIIDEPSGRGSPTSPSNLDRLYPRNVVRDRYGLIDPSLTDLLGLTGPLHYAGDADEFHPSEWLSPWRYPVTNQGGETVPREGAGVHGGPYVAGDTSSILLPGPAGDDGARQTLEQSASPTETFNALDQLFTQNKHLGGPVDYGVYLVGRMVAERGNDEFGVPDFNLDSDRGYAWKCWDWDRHNAGPTPDCPRGQWECVPDFDPTPQSDFHFLQPCTPPHLFHADHDNPCQFQNGNPKETQWYNPKNDLRVHYLSRAVQQDPPADGPDPCASTPPDGGHVGPDWGSLGDWVRSARKKEGAVSPANDDHDPHPITHPELSPGEAARQRGEDPSNAIGPWPTRPHDPRDPDPKFQPDPKQLKLLIGLYGELSKRHRPRREDVLPYEMIRAFVPGDRGARPTWPPTPCWESPDIMLIDAELHRALRPGSAGRLSRQRPQLSRVRARFQPGPPGGRRHSRPRLVRRAGLLQRPAGDRAASDRRRLRRSGGSDAPGIDAHRRDGSSLGDSGVVDGARMPYGGGRLSRRQVVGQLRREPGPAPRPTQPRHRRGRPEPGTLDRASRRNAARRRSARGSSRRRSGRAAAPWRRRGSPAPARRARRSRRSSRRICECCVTVCRSPRAVTCSPPLASRPLPWRFPPSCWRPPRCRRAGRTTDREPRRRRPAHPLAEPGVAVRMLRSLDPKASATKDIVLVGGAKDFAKLLPDGPPKDARRRGPAASSRRRGTGRRARSRPPPAVRRHRREGTLSSAGTRSWSPEPRSRGDAETRSSRKCFPCCSGPLGRRREIRV